MKAVGPTKNVRRKKKKKKTVIEVLVWSLLTVTWASYGMHVLRQFIGAHIEKGE